MATSVSMMLTIGHRSASLVARFNGSIFEFGVLGQRAREEMATMAKSSVGKHMACKPTLDGTADVIAGYRAFHVQEGKYTALALDAMPDAVATWYRLLSLFDRALRREHESPSTELDDQHRVWEIRLRLVSTSAATAKLALDATLAGYYSQAYALLRHLLETWQQMVYVRVNPSEAKRWWSPDGILPASVPSTNKITNGLTAFGKTDRELGHNAAQVVIMIKEFHKGAHPSGLIVSQTNAGKAGFAQLGANFDRRFLANVMSKGTAAMALLLQEYARTSSVDTAWREEFAKILQSRTRWHEPEASAAI